MKPQPTVTPWLLARPGEQDEIRLFCLPYAGGGASIYREWTRALPAGAGVYPIQLPGRENRIAEPLLYTMEELVEAVSEAIAPYLQRPFILFGHSVGARIAFELARSLRRKWRLRPCHLLVSGSRAPHLPESTPLHRLPDDAFVKELRRFSGTPEVVLQNRELMEIFIPILRADFTVSETYTYAEDAPLDCPIAAFGGTGDPEADPEEIAAWVHHTGGDFTMEMFEGDHFFLQTARASLLHSVGQIILRHLHQCRKAAL